MPKTKLTLSVDPEVVARAQRFSDRNETTLSQLVEQVLASLEDTGTPTATEAPAPDVAVAASCCGQGSAVFAQTGAMGKHSSSFANPRLGIRNLARAPADAGLIPDDTMALLGAYVADELGLSIDTCTP